MKRVLAILPAYNEEKAVASVVEGVRRHGLPVLVVDDASSDATSASAGAAGASVVRHPENRGKGGAVISGVEYARGRGYTHVLVLDADGQHDTSEVPRFLDALEVTSADVVLGTRMRAPEGMPPVRYLTNRFMSLVVSALAGQRITDSQSGFRLMSLAVWEKVHLESRRFDAESEFLVKACRLGFRLVEVPIKTLYAEEASKVKPLEDTLRFFRLLGRLSWWLLRHRSSRRVPKDAT